MMTKPMEVRLAGDGDKDTSSNSSIVNEAGSVRFSCPSCGNYTIVRSVKSRKLATKYTCPACGFEGPN